MAKSYFAILEVSPSASADEIRSAYRRLAKEFHPDYYDGDSKHFRQIQEAYSVLSDADKRKFYEKTLSGVAIHSPSRRAAYPEPEPLCPRSGFAGVETLSPAFDEMNGIFDRLWDFWARF